MAAIEADRLAASAAKVDCVPLSASLFYRADRIRVVSERLMKSLSSSAALEELDSLERACRTARVELGFLP